MRRTVGWALSALLLLGTGAVGIHNGINDLSGAATPLQYSVTVGVILYGVLGLAAGGLLVLRHRWSVWLAAAWTVVVTFVSSTAPLAYAGSSATVVGAVFGGIGAALIGGAVVWAASAAVRSGAARRSSLGKRDVAAVIFLLGCGSLINGCRTLYGGSPVVRSRENDGLLTKRVRAKREPDQLIAEDLSVCWVIPEVFRGIRPGDAWRCAWRYVPEER
jgi:hypothetical protein